ncbi:unnamed protein product [[Candida] boidinii]|nr:unnamed protein product [[Candida] boidinii]
MIKNLLGGKKLRNEAVSAVPNILSSISAIEQQKQQQLPPTLFSNLMTQVKRGDITNYNNNNPHGIGINQPVNAKSVIDDLPDNIRNAANGEVDKRSFGERYGTCQDVIGSGAFGVVRIAHKKLPNGQEALFAVKEFRKKPSESEKKYSRRLTNEFCISSSLRHLNIIDTLDLLRDAKDEYCEVMEYCAGGDLYSLIITAGKLEYSEADCFFKQLLRGVHYMHEMGVAHRDLKPENLLLTSNGTLKITDFGNAECFKAAWEEDISYTGGICGSSPYIAPEEFTTEEFDARAVDIWACGVIYMAMRSGRQLWKVANTDDEFFNIYLSKRKDAKGYEPIEALKRARCRNVVYSILDPIPERRISSIQILNSEWVREIHVCCAGDSYHRENR